MHTTLTIKDLASSIELDRAALCAVRGGQDDQANGIAQANGQTMASAANVGNVSKFGGPATIQSDNTFSQSAGNYSCATNFDFASFGLCFPSLR
jgi:hypothetical protein